MNIESFKIYFPLVNTSIESLSIMLEFLKKTECEDSPFNLAIYSNFYFILIVPTPSISSSPVPFLDSPPDDTTWQLHPNSWSLRNQIHTTSQC